MSSLKDIAQILKDSKEPITLIYAFNSTGKTKLSVEYKNLTKKEDGKHTGVYYNAYSEDLFRWDNDEPNDNENMRLVVIPSSLNPYFSSIIENPNLLNEKLARYLPAYTYSFDINANPEIGIDAIRFARGEEQNIKISRGEERIFVWCFFLALFDAGVWTSEQDAHFFIDDPVTSLDDYNVFITADSIIQLIDDKIGNSQKKLILTTHHVGLYSILFDRLMKGEKSSKYRNLCKPLILTRKEDEFELKNHTNDVFLFHLRLMQILEEAISSKLYIFHFVLLRQLLENISSFIGSGRFGYVLSEIGVENPNEISERINTLSHQNVSGFQSIEMSSQQIELFKDIFNKLKTKYNFKY
ncbi:MAG: AAA family ATPase [Cyclobacteriaceae bacterium]|nr:AAA family ATPase [Cyclobacteriaceae bacterium]